MESSFKSWKEWAIRSGIHQKVLGFLAFGQNLLMNFDASSEELAFATPRSWEMVSKLLTNVDDSVDRMYSMISGLVGTAVALEFRTWEQVYRELPSLDDIFDGKKPSVPTKPDVLYALTAAMTAYARDHKEDMAKIANSVRYAELLPPDFSVMMLKDYMYIEKDYREKLLRIPEFSRWLQTKGRLLNGSN